MSHWCEQVRCTELTFLPAGRSSAITLSTLLAAILVSGCVAYPVYKKLQPAATATIRDVQGTPIMWATVTLVSSSYPYRREKSRDTAASDADGMASFAARYEWRTELLAMHGWEEYFWNWCVQKEGFETFSTTYTGAAEFEAQAIVTLKTGSSKPCPHGYSLATNIHPQHQRLVP